MLEPRIVTCLLQGLRPKLMDCLPPMLSNVCLRSTVKALCCGNHESHRATLHTRILVVQHACFVTLGNHKRHLRFQKLVL